MLGARTARSLELKTAVSLEREALVSILYGWGVTKLTDCKADCSAEGTHCNHETACSGSVKVVSQLEEAGKLGT